MCSESDFLFRFQNIVENFVIPSPTWNASNRFFNTPDVYQEAYLSYFIHLFMLF